MGMRKCCDYCIDVGRRIKDAREERRTTQEELGRQLGVAFQMIQRWERGEQLTIERIVTIALVLKLDPTWLITGKIGAPPELCRALSDTSVRLERAGSATELLDVFKRRNLMRLQLDPLLGIQPLPMAVGDLLRGMFLTITPASRP